MELHDWIIIGLLTVLLVLVVFSLVLSFKKKEVNNIEDNLKENTNQIVGNLKSEVTALSNSFVNMFTLFTSSQSEANKSFVQNVESQIKLANDGQSKANLEIEQKLENIRNSVEKSINTLKENTDKRLENVREQIEKSLTSIQLENSKKLEEMRQTVDEKLQSTLNARITESFKTVSDSLEKVTKGLGEMQTLATGVG